MNNRTSKSWFENTKEVIERGLEIMGIGVIDIDNHECMTLGSIQTPDCKTLDNMGKNLVDWVQLLSYQQKRQDTEHFQNGGCRRILFQGNFHNAYV